MLNLTTCGVEQYFSPDIIFYYYIPLPQISPDFTRLSLTEKRQKLKLFKLTLLSKICGRQITVADLTVRADGKPELKDTDVTFTVSHSQDYYLIAWIYKKINLGVDIENKARKISARARARVFSAADEVYVRHQADADAAALKLWTMREAWFKAQSAAGGSNKQLRAGLSLSDFISLQTLVRADSGYQFLSLTFADQTGSICTDEPHLKELQRVN